MSAPHSRPQAAPEEPHWVVVALHHDQPAEAKDARKNRNWRRLFRHPSEDLAVAECNRLASLAPGIRFQVYASRFSCKIDKPAEAP